jgi:hypothetical protein
LVRETTGRVWELADVLCHIADPGEPEYLYSEAALAIDGGELVSLPVVITPKAVAHVIS